MKFAYADPPYPGKARYYPEKKEVDYRHLIENLLETCYPDGWALSVSSAGLRDVLQYCPKDVRVCAWVKGPRKTKSMRPLVSWEPLIVAHGRKLETRSVCDIYDSLVYAGRYRAFPGAIIGMKPPQFAEWMFRSLGALQGDTLDDLYPGSGAISVAWARYAAMEDSR